MSRTYRNIPYKHYWGMSKQELKTFIDTCYPGKFVDSMKRDYLLHGTDSRNHSIGTTEYFKVAHRKGRRIERDKLRPHLVQDEYYDFDDSEYLAKYKSVWWDIY